MWTLGLYGAGSVTDPLTKNKKCERNYKNEKNISDNFGFGNGYEHVKRSFCKWKQSASKNV
jgi:hypothetical protein